jgi:hypothetical protein
MISLQNPWGNPAGGTNAPCDGSQVVSAKDTYLVSSTGTVTIDFSGANKNTQSATEYYLCLSSNTIATGDQAFTNNALKAYFTIDTLFSVWLVSDSHVPAAGTVTDSPCVCSSTCTVQILQSLAAGTNVNAVDCAKIKLYGPVAPPTNSLITNLGGVKNSWTPLNAVYGTVPGYEFGIPTGQDWWMPIQVSTTAGTSYATRGPFDPSYFQNGGWTISFVAATVASPYCGGPAAVGGTGSLGAALAAAKPDWISGLNWIPDNRTSVTLGAATTTFTSGSIGWVRISEKAADSSGLLCVGVSATGATPSYLTTGLTSQHDFFAVGTSPNFYRVNKVNPLLQRFGGLVTAAGGLTAGIAGAPQMYYSPGTVDQYATSHVNVEVDVSTTLSNTDTPASVNGATILVSLQKGACGTGDLTGISTPTFVEVRLSAKQNAALNTGAIVAADWERKAFARLYTTQLKDDWSDLNVCYAVVPVWFHRFNLFGTTSWYGSNGKTLDPSPSAANTHQFFFPTPSVSAAPETAIASLFKQATSAAGTALKFTIVPIGKLPRIEKFGRRTGESCDAVGFVDGEGNAGIPVSLSCKVDEVIGSSKIGNLLDIVVGIAENAQCIPFTNSGSNGRYGIQRVPLKISCPATGKDCTWSALPSGLTSTCGYTAVWSSSTSQTVCYPGSQSFTDYFENAQLSGWTATTTSAIAQKQDGALCVAIVPKMNAATGWHTSGFDVNDMIQASKLHRKLNLNMLVRASWSAVAINNLGSGTTGAVLNVAQRVPVQVQFTSGYTSSSNCPLNAFQIHFCYVRGSFAANANTNPCDRITATGTPDCGLVTGCSEGISESTSTYNGWATIKATGAAGEAIVCAQISSSYGYDASTPAASVVAGIWDPSKTWDTTWAAKAPLGVPQTATNLFYIIDPPSILTLGGVAPNSGRTIGVPHEDLRTRYIPVAVDDVSKLMPAGTAYTVSSNMQGVSRTATDARVRVIDLLITLTNAPTCNQQSLVHYEYTTDVNTFVAYSATKDWSTQFTFTSPTTAQTRFAQLKFVRPAYRQVAGGRAAHGPTTTNARLCYAWIPVGWTHDSFAQDLTVGTTTIATCRQAIAFPYIAFTDAKIYYSQVVAPTRLNYVRDTCGSVGTKYHNIPVYAYDATGAEIIGTDYQNISVYVSQQETCAGKLPPLNYLTASTGATATPYPYTLLATLGANNQDYLSIDQDSLAYPTLLNWERGRLWYRGYTHHYVSTFTCVVVAPSWIVNGPQATDADVNKPVWTAVFGADLGRIWGIDKEDILSYRLSAVDFNDNNARYSTRRFRNSAGTATRFHATPTIAVPQIATVGTVVVNRGAAATNMLYVPSFSNTLNPTDATQTQLLYPGAPRFTVTLVGLTGLYENPALGPTDSMIQIIRQSETCGTVEPYYDTAQKDDSITGACCQANVTRRNFIPLSYHTMNGVSTPIFEMDLIYNFQQYNNETNAANVTTCYKVCQTTMACGETPSKGNFTAANFQVCIVPEVLVRNQIPILTPLPSILLQQRTPVNFTNPSVLTGLCPYISFQTTTTTSITSLESAQDYTKPIPILQDSLGWYFSLSSASTAFWDSLRTLTKSGTKIYPQFAVSHCGQTIGTTGTDDKVSDSEISEYDFNYAYSLRSAYGMAQPQLTYVLAPTCNEYSTFISTVLPPHDTAACDAFKEARQCPTVISMFGKSVTGPRLVSLSETCTALSANLTANQATVVGAGSHQIPLAGYKLDSVNTWVSLQPITSSNYPCDGQRSITGISIPRKVSLNQDCSNTTQLTDMWGIQYQACPQQNGYFTLTLSSAEVGTSATEYAICVAFLNNDMTPLSSDFNDRLDTFKQTLNSVSSASWCGSTCQHPIKLHVVVIPTTIAPVVNCLGGCTVNDLTRGDSTIAYAPANSRSQMPIQITRPSALSALGNGVDPDIWVALEPYDPLRPACRGNDILIGKQKCANGNQLHTLANQTRYYPLKVQRGFSQYNPGMSKNNWFLTNYSLILDALRTDVSVLGPRYTLCYAVTTTGVAPQANFFSAANGAASPTCTLNLVRKSLTVASPGVQNLNVCEKKPRAYLTGLNTQLETFVSLQKDPACGDIDALVRGADETFSRVSQVADSRGRYYYNLTERQYTNTGLTVCVAQVACGAVPTINDFQPAFSSTKINVITPSTFVYPTAGLTQYTCDGSKPNSGCKETDVGFTPCKVKTSDTTQTCVYAAAGCPVARCSVDGVCGNPAIPVSITDDAGITLYEGCNIRVRSAYSGRNTQLAGNLAFQNITNARIADGLLNYSNYWQPYGTDCNSFIFEADCGCGANISKNMVPTFSVKTQMASWFNVTYFPECLFLPTTGNKYLLGFNVTQEKQFPVMVNVLDTTNTSMVGDVLSTATITAVDSSCTQANAASCTAATCISLTNNVRTIGRGGPVGWFNFSGVIVNPLTGTTGCNVKLLITYSMSNCVIGSKTFYSVSPNIIPVSTIQTSVCAGGRIASLITDAPDGTLPAVPLHNDAQYSSPAPIVAGSATPTPTPTPAMYSAGAKFAAKTVASIASYPSLAANYGKISEFQVCPGRHADLCATPLNISMMLNGPSVRKNDGSNTNPELVVRFPLTGDQLSTNCIISHAAGPVAILSSWGFNVAPTAASWSPQYCELTVILGCSQVTGRISIQVGDFTINTKNDPGNYPAVTVRDRDVYDPASPPNILFLTENVNPTCDEVNPIIDRLDVAVVDDACKGKANLEICMTTTNEIQAAGSAKIEFRTLGTSQQFTHTDGAVRVNVFRVGGIKAIATANATAIWTSASGTNPAVLTIMNRGVECWTYGQLCFKVFDFNVPDLPTTDPGEYCASSYSPSNTPIDVMQVDPTTTRRCVNAASDTVNSISDLSVSTPSYPTVGDLNFPVTFTFTLSRGLKPFDCIKIDVPYFQNNNPVLPMITTPTTLTGTTEVKGITSRYYDVVNGFVQTRSEYNANPARFFNALYTNNAGCGGQLQLCTSCAIGGLNQNGTDFCTRLSFTVDNFFAPALSTFDTCTQAALTPFASGGRLVNWNIQTPDLTNNNFNKEKVYPQNILGAAKLEIYHTYTVPIAGTAYPYNRYAREAHAAHLTLFFTLVSSQSLLNGDLLAIQFPCDEGKRYASDLLFFQNSPMANCKANAQCTHSCLQNPVWNQATNTLTVTLKCPFEAGTTLPFALAPFTAPHIPAKKETFKYQVSITRGPTPVDSAVDTLALKHDLDGIYNFAVSTSSCVAGDKTTLTVGLSITKDPVVGGAIVIAFPDNTWHPSYSTMLRSNSGLVNLASGLEGLIPLTVTAQYQNQYEVYWRNQTYEVWNDASHKPIMESNRNLYGDREQALLIFPKQNKKFSSKDIKVEINGLVNPWKRSWDSTSYGAATTNTASPNPSGAYRGNWQFKRIEYRADAFGTDGNARGGSAQQTGTPTAVPAQTDPTPTGASWYMAGGDNYFIHLPVIRTHDWYIAPAARAARIAGNRRLSSAYVTAPAPYQQYTGFPFSSTVDLNYPNANVALYATEADAALALTPAGLNTGIRELSVVPSDRKVGAKNVFLTVSFRTCASIGRSGRIDIHFGVQNLRDNQVLTGAIKDSDGNVALLTTVTQFQGQPFMNIDGPVSVEEVNPTTGVATGRSFEGYFRRERNAAGQQQAGGILSVTALDEFSCGKAQSDQWKFILGRKYGGFTTSPFPITSLPANGGPSPVNTAECLDPGYYQIVTYSHGCSTPPLACGGDKNVDRITCGGQVVEVSTFLNPIDDYLNDDSIIGNISFVEREIIPADNRVGQRMPGALDTILRFSVWFRKRVTEGDTLVFTFPNTADQGFWHSIDATITEARNATYRPLLKKAATYDNTNRVLTVTFDRSPVLATDCASKRLSGGECLVQVSFTVDGFKNPARCGSLPNATVALNLQVSQQTQTISSSFRFVTLEKVQFTATLLTPQTNAVSDMLFEFPSVPFNVGGGNKIKVKFPPAFQVQSGPFTVLMPNLYEGIAAETSFLTAARDPQDTQTLVLTIPPAPTAAQSSEPRNYATCAINNARRLMHQWGQPGLRGRTRNCASFTTQATCIAAGCVSDCAGSCSDGNLDRTSIINFINDSQITTQNLQSGFRVLVQNVVQNPARPGDPGAYELRITDASDNNNLVCTGINPSNENIEENTDLIQGIDFFDIKPAACTWATSRDARSVALDLSFINYGAKRGASPGVEIPNEPWVTPYNAFNGGSPSNVYLGKSATYTNYAEGPSFNMWRNGKMHQIEVCFPEAAYSYTWMGRGTDRFKRSYDPLYYLNAPRECANPLDKETDNTIPVSFRATTRFNLTELGAWTTHVPIEGSWFTPAIGARCANIEGASVRRPSQLFARWLPDTRCVLIETYEDLPNGKYTFRLGDEANMNGFTQGTPLSDSAMSSKNVDLLGPKSGIIRDKNDNKQYVVTIRDRYDDTRDEATFFDTKQTKFWNKQCMAPIPIHQVSFVPPSDAVRSGISDFDVVPSKSSPLATNVWLTFSMTVDVSMTQSSGLDIIFPPASWNRGPIQKCQFTLDEIDVEVLSHTQLGQPSATSKLMASAKWIFKTSDYKNEQLGGIRDTNAGVLRLNFTVIDAPWKAVEPGYLVFRVGGWTNPPRIGDPSRPITGPWGQPAEYWSGVNWYNNPRNTDWKVEVFEYSFGDKNDRVLSQAGSTIGTATGDGTCGNTPGGNRNAVYARGSMNAPSDYIGSLYCGPEGIKLNDGTVRDYAFDVIPSRNSINSAADELDLSLDLSFCVRRDIPEGSRIVLRLPADSFETPTCGRQITISSDDANAPGLSSGTVYVDRLSNYNFYDGNTQDMFNPIRTQTTNPNGPVNYGNNRFESELSQRELTDKDRERYTGNGAYPTNTNGVTADTTASADALLRNRRTITIIVGPGGIKAPERPKWYDTSATSTLTSTNNDRFGTRGPTGVRLFTFKLAGFTAPCSVKTYLTATGTYASQDLPTADLGEYDVRVEFGNASLISLRNTKLVPCTDRTKDPAFTMQTYYAEENGNNDLWTYLRNDIVDNLYPNVETLPLANEHPDILEARDIVPVPRKSNFVKSPSNPRSDAVWGITNDFNFNFELKIVDFENDRQCGTRGLNPLGTGAVDVSKYAPNANSRLQFTLELPSCFVSRETGVRRAPKTGIKTNENDGDKLIITFPQSSYRHKCGKVDVSNVPKHYEQYFRNLDSALPRSSQLDAWAPNAGLGNSYVRISDFNNDYDLINQQTPMVEILSAEWTADANELAVFGPLADWRISQPKPAAKCTSSRRHIVKFEACCFQLPGNFSDPGAFKLKYMKHSKREEPLVELLSQDVANPKCDTLPNPASCDSMWGGCGDQMKECVTGTADQARCICIPNHATCCNASHGFNINRATGLYAGNATLFDDGGVFGYCDKWTSSCEKYENENWGSRCSTKLYMRPRTRGLSIAVPCILFVSILISLIVVIYFVKDQLANIIGPLVLGILICAFSSACLLCREWYTAFGFAALAIFNIFASHPPSNSRYMVVCLMVEGLMLLSFFSTGKVLPTRTTQTLIPVYDAGVDGLLPEPACIAYYGYYAVDQALVYDFRDSPQMVGRRLCSRAWIMTLDIFFAFIIALFLIFWFVNLYFLGRQREAESKERRERRTHSNAKDTTVRMLVAENTGEVLPPVEEVAFPNDAVA